MAAGDRPAPYGPQLSAFLSRRGATEEDLREIAEDFHYAPFHAPSQKRHHRAPQTSGLVDEGVKAGHALKALDGGSWPAAWVPQRKRRDATKIDEVGRESHSVATAHRSKRATTSWLMTSSRVLKREMMRCSRRKHSGRVRRAYGFP